MPRLTPEDASLVLDHVVGDRSVPPAAASAILAALPFPSRPTPRLLRSVLLRRLDSDPVSSAALDSLHLIASLPSPAAPLAAAHLAVAAFLVASAPEFDAAARALFARPGVRARRPVDEGGHPALVSAEAVAVADQFESAVGDALSQAVLKGLWGDRTAAEERVRELLAAEWAAIGPSLLEVAAERIVGEGAIETWRAADEQTRAKYRILAGEERSREILSKLEEPTSNANPLSTLEIRKVMEALKSSCADLHRVVEDPLPAAKAAADEVTLAELMESQTLRSEEDSLDSEGSGSQLRRPHLPTPRRIPVSPLQLADTKAKRRKARRWSKEEEEALRVGVEQFGNGNWKEILIHSPDVFIGRTEVNLKDKWRNMEGR